MKMRNTRLDKKTEITANRQAWTLDHEAAEDFNGDWLDKAAAEIEKKYPVEKES